MDFRLEPAALYAQVVNDFGKSDNRLEIEPTSWGFEDKTMNNALQQGAVILFFTNLFRTMCFCSFFWEL
jgi:hypothetical protein